VPFKQQSACDRPELTSELVKKTQKAAITLSLAILIWLLLRDRTVVVTIMAIIAVKLAALAIMLSLAAFLVWLIGPQALYRRYIGGYIRLRRIRRSQHVRQLREAAARTTDQ
jgi:hypothetical protein